MKQIGEHIIEFRLAEKVVQKSCEAEMQHHVEGLARSGRPLLDSIDDCVLRLAAIRLKQLAAAQQGSTAEKSAVSALRSYGNILIGVATADLVLEDLEVAAATSELFGSS